MKHDIEALQRRHFSQILREHFEEFLKRAFFEMHGYSIKWNWHHDVMCDSLFSCAFENQKRLIINVPPRSLKSFICNVAWPAWLMGRNPKIQIISISYAQELSSKFSRDQRQLMSSDFYKQLFPGTCLNPKKSGEAEFELTKGGFRLATSTGGVLTGRGADLIIIDDPIKPQDAMSETQRLNCNEWIENTLMTRLNDKTKGVMVMIMQRLHEDDPTGHFLEKGGWTHFSFPAVAVDDETWNLRNGKSINRHAGDVLHTEHEPISVLNNLKSDMGSMNFSSQYQQQPLPMEGNIVKKEWFRYYSKLPENRHKQYIMSIDTAMKDGANNDWSVITVWVKCGQNYYLIDVTRKKMNFPELQNCVKQTRQKYPSPRILIEDKGSGTSLIQQLRVNGIYCTPCKPIGDKVQRFSSASIAFEQGRVFFPDNNPPWLECLEHELLTFPGCKHDDQVDSVSQFLNYVVTQGEQRARIVKLSGL